jgi:hypothetical protein
MELLGTEGLLEKKDWENRNDHNKLFSISFLHIFVVFEQTSKKKNMVMFRIHALFRDMCIMM